MADPIELALDVNGRPVTVTCQASEPLSVVLRRELRTFGVREACAIGVCGSCTVLLDGEAVSSCLTPTIAAEGRAITTVEGLADGDTLHPVQQKFVDKQAFQCSFCTPGFILSTVAMLADEPPSTREKLREELGGCLCRCVSYEFIEEAVVELIEEADPGRISR